MINSVAEVENNLSKKRQINTIFSGFAEKIGNRL